MAKNDLIGISEEVVDLLIGGGNRCERFLEQVAKDREIISSFCKQEGIRLTGVYVGTENVEEEPVYSFSDQLGMYTSAGIKASINSK